VTVILPNDEKSTTTPEAMAVLTGDSFAVRERVPGALGEGFDLRDWYREYVRSANDGKPAATDPTHLTVRASDEFQATIPWAQLGGSLLQYAIDGQPLAKGNPVRLYVPDGTSACLNVKSVVVLHFVADASLGDEAAYGFQNEVSPDQLIKGLKTR
jgi:hypothetical protein